MKEAEFNILDSLADTAFLEVEKWLDSSAVESLKVAMQRAAEQLPNHVCSELGVELRAFDENREKSVRLLTIGLNANRTCSEPFRGSGDCSSQRYVVNGELCEIPHDYCPNCWGNWDFKLLHPVCPECGYTLGREVRILLDSDVCPYCEAGTISSSKPNCEKCGFKIDPAFVNWG